MNISSVFGNVALAVVGVQVVAAGALDEYRWKDRLVLVALPQGAEHREGLEKLFNKHRDAIEERKLTFIDISASPLGLPFATRLEQELIESLRKQYLPANEQGEAVFILIGKDGGEKARQSGPLNLAKWFVLIDGMPMRRAEIRDQRK